MKEIRTNAIIVAALMAGIVYMAFAFYSASVTEALELLRSDVADDVRQGALTLVGHAGIIGLAMAVVTGLAGALSELVKPPPHNDAAEIALALVEALRDQLRDDPLEQ